MSKQVMQKALESLTLARSQLDVLWVSHHANRTDASLASADDAIAELRAAIAAPEVEPVAWTVTEMDSVITNDDKQTNAIQFSQRYLDMHDIPLYATPSSAEAMRRDSELGRVAMRFVDRAGDVHPGIDDAETICADFYKAMCAAIEAQGGGE